MNFRFFSLVGFVCACAPFGVSSTQKVDNYKVTLELGFFQVFLDNFNEIKESCREIQTAHKENNNEITKQLKSFYEKVEYLIVHCNDMTDKAVDCLGELALLNRGIVEGTAASQTTGVLTLVQKIEAVEQKLNSIEDKLNKHHQLFLTVVDGCGIEIQNRWDEAPLTAIHQSAS